VVGLYFYEVIYLLANSRVGVFEYVFWQMPRSSCKSLEVLAVWKKLHGAFSVIQSCGYVSGSLKV
jgi:hypothetical protein